MSIIKIPLHYEGSKGEKFLYTLFDSGSSYSIISPENAEALGAIEKMNRPMNLATAAEGVYLNITHRVTLDFYYNDIRLSDEFMVVPGVSEDAIIGANTLQKWRIKLDFDNDTVIVDPKVGKAIFK